MPGRQAPQAVTPVAVIPVAISPVAGTSVAGTSVAGPLVPGQRPEIEPEIVAAKLASLVEGARIATKMLW